MTMSLIRCVLLVVALAAVASPARGQQPAGPPDVPERSEQQGEFVPAESIPQRERIPAAPLLIGAYAFALVAVFGYVLSVSRRLAAVKSDITRLEGDLRRGGRG